jgi:hypothetical protein
MKVKYKKKEQHGSTFIICSNMYKKSRVLPGISCANGSKSESNYRSMLLH